MAIFVVIISRQASPNAFPEMLKEKFENNHFLVAPNVWLVAGKGPAQDMSGSLGINDNSVAAGIVAGIDTYYGRAPTNVWDWIKAKWEETSASE